MHADNNKVLIVGASSEYRLWARRVCPGQVVFLSESVSSDRKMNTKTSDEIFCELSDFEKSVETLRKFLSDQKIILSGITCFDCESMVLTACLAETFSLSYPSQESVRACRDKYASKKILQCAGIHSPQAALVSNAEAAYRFLQKTKRACVLKPLYGGGSELVFDCNTREELNTCFTTITRELKDRKENRLFFEHGSEEHKIVIEEKIEGTEYSCDFIIDNDRLEIIRISRKIYLPDGPFGTVRGYSIQNGFPNGIPKETITELLFRSANALGIERAVCMADFIVSGETISVLEITPRPGGDCIPYLLLKAANLDIIKLAINFAMQKSVWAMGISYHKTYAGIRIHAPEAGILRRLDINGLKRETRIKEIHFSRRPGHVIKLPPKDYDSWNLGHLIVKPYIQDDTEGQCHEIMNHLVVEIDAG